MKNLKKLAACAASAILAAASVGCTPTIGSGTKTAMTVEGYDVPAGVFLYYTLQSYDEAASNVKTDGGDSPTVKDVKNTIIDDKDSSDWIQDKVTEYCISYVSLVKEFNELGLSLSDEDKSTAKEMAEYYHSADPRMEENGISLDSMIKVAESTYMEQEIFKHYYGFEGDKGCSEDELKDYFDDNFARVKYVSISLTGDDGELLDEDKQRELRKMAEKYASQINSKKKEIDKMLEVDKVSDDYDEYVAANTTTASDSASLETTTTTVAETTSESTEETTTTDLYANEKLIQKNTTTTAAENKDDTTETTVAESSEPSDDDKFNDFIFNDIEKDKAVVYDYNDKTIYVVIRGDLRERMTEDDYWSEDYVSRLLQLRYYDEFVEFLKEKSASLSAEKNTSAYRRYDPFKLELE